MKDHATKLLILCAKHVEEQLCRFREQQMSSLNIEIKKADEAHKQYAKLCVGTSLDRKYESGMKKIFVPRKDWGTGKDSVVASLEKASTSLYRAAEAIKSRREAMMECDIAPPKYNDILREILALRKIFDHVEYDPKRKVLFVQTKPVILEYDGYRVELGRFQINLLAGHLSEFDSPFRIVALDPKPAYGDSNITHPHIRDNVLCEGAGKAAINNAIFQGRVCDFFEIVNQTINTYGARSPYVAISEWTYIQCAQCGSKMYERNAIECETCHAKVCNACLRTCRCCSKSKCSGCVKNKTVGDYTVSICTSCLDTDKGKNLLEQISKSGAKVTIENLDSVIRWPTIKDAISALSEVV
jgi:hypothetical protein